MSFVLALHAGWPIEIVYWGTLFYRVFPRSFLPSFVRPSLFYLLPYIRSVALPPRSRISILFLSRICDPFAGKQRLRGKAKTAKQSPIVETMVTRIWEGRTFVVGLSWDHYNHNDIFRYNIWLENFTSFRWFFSSSWSFLSWPKSTFTSHANVISRTHHYTHALLRAVIERNS